MLSVQIREKIQDLKTAVQHLNSIWEEHGAHLLDIHEYQVFLKEAKMVDDTSAGHEVGTGVCVWGGGGGN